jgi:hypothetical protein
MSLAKTNLQDVRANYPSNLDRDELRSTQTGLLMAAEEMTTSPSSIVSPDLRLKAETSEGRNLDIPVMKKGNITISNVRSCTIGGGISESDLIRVTWKTVVADILMVPSRYETNQIGYTFDFAKQIRETVEAFKIEIENDLDTAFDANKSQVYGSTIVGTKYPLTGAAIQVPPSQLDFFFNDLEPVNFADDFNDPTIRVIANHVVMPTVSKFINQGGGNAVNTTFQFAGKNFTFSNRISNGAGKLATGYFMPDGSVGLLTRVAVDSRMGHKGGDGTEWMEETLPGLSFPIGVQFKSKCDDKSAMEVAGLGHLTATLVEHYQISFDYAIVVPYNSNLATKPSSIRKFEFVAEPVAP